MPFLQPEKVHSPRARWKLHRAFHSEGPGKIALAWGHWDGREVIAARWNGSEDSGKSLGNPQSSGHATWFIIPDWMAASVLRAVHPRCSAAEDSHLVGNLVSKFEALGTAPTE